MVDRRTAEYFFSKKVVGSVRNEGGRHTAYHIRASSGRVILGNLTISRGPSGEDLALNNLKGLATDMGLSLEGLVEASRCNIRQEVVLLCAVSRVLTDAELMHRLDPIAYDKATVGLLGVALEEWLMLLGKFSTSKLSAKEHKELSRCRSRLEDMASKAAVGPIAEKMLVRVVSILTAVA